MFYLKRVFHILILVTCLCVPALPGAGLEREKVAAAPATLASKLPAAIPLANVPETGVLPGLSGAALQGIVAVTAGSWRTCALTSGGGVKCWGDDRTTTTHSVPMDVAGLTNGITAITAGGGHTCVLTNGGGVKCWGDNYNGELGDGTTTYRSTPVDVVGLASSVTAIAAGGDHTCALIGNSGSGGVKCWGNNDYGQLGDGTTEDHNAPVDVVGLSSGVTAIATGSWHTCALTSSGGAKCWGLNFEGQLGDGTTVNHSTPTDVVGLASGATDIEAGGDHTCALAGNGRLKCWGSDMYGELRVGSSIHQLTPVDVVDSVPPQLLLNYTTGKPGSPFTLTGEGFPPSSTASIIVNGHILTTTVPVLPCGDLVLFLDTASAEAGGYQITASVNPSAMVMLTLDNAAPLRVQEGGGASLVIPEGIALYWVYLPLTLRSFAPQ